jgi:hypothetical protein
MNSNVERLTEAQIHAAAEHLFGGVEVLEKAVKLASEKTEDVLSRGIIKRTSKTPQNNFPDRGLRIFADSLQQATSKYHITDEQIDKACSLSRLLGANTYSLGEYILMGMNKFHHAKAGLLGK